MVYRNYKKMLHAFHSIISIAVLGMLIFAVPDISASQEWKHYGKKEGLAGEYVKSIAIDRAYLWAGTSTGACRMEKSSGKWKTFTKLDGLADNFINDILIDGDDVWFATVKGLSRFSQKTGKWMSYFKKDGLSDEYINCIFQDGNRIYFGTKYWGVSVYDKAAGSWSVYTAIDGLAGNSINGIVSDGEQIFFATDNGLSIFNKNDLVFKNYDSKNTDFGLGRDNIIAISVDSRYVWCGTEGEGIFRFNKDEERWDKFSTKDQLLDDFILSLERDGSYVWVGTFGGVNCYSMIDNTWVSYREGDGLSESSINTIAVDGNYVWFGTGGGGLSKLNKNNPQIRLSPSTSYIDTDKVEVTGTVFDYNKISDFHAYFKPSGTENEWFDKNIILQKKDNGWDERLGIWNTSGLIDGVYDIKVDATSSDGGHNSDILLFVVDTISPVVSLNAVPEYSTADSIQISGTFFDNNIDELFLNPGHQKVNADNVLKTFTVNVNLKEGENLFEVIATDKAKHKTVIPVRVVKDIQKPELALDPVEKQSSKKRITVTGTFKEPNILKISVRPGDFSVILDTAHNRFSTELDLKNGNNDFVIRIDDKAGNFSEAPLSIHYSENNGLIELLQCSSMVNFSNQTIKGRIISANVDKISLEAGNRSSPVTVSKETGAFTSDVVLTKGKNFISIKATQKRGVPFTLLKEIVYDPDLPQLSYDNNSVAVVKEKSFSVTGFFKEAYPDKIIINPGTVEAAINNRKFSGSVELKEGDNLIETVMMDKAGNRSAISRHIVMDTVPPRITGLDYPKYSNKKNVLISGSFVEQNPMGITINKNNAVFVDTVKKTFSVPVDLKNGENSFILELADLAGQKDKKTADIVYDSVPPVLTIEHFSDIVNTPEWTVSGFVKDQDPDFILIAPGDIRIVPQDGVFSATLRLQRGMNKISLTAWDRAGNQKRTNIEVSYKDDKEENNVSSDRIKALELEVARLKQNGNGNPQNEPVPPFMDVRFNRLSLPQTSALVFVPYFISSGDTISKVSQDYLGNAFESVEILRYNGINPEIIRERQKLLIPTRQMIGFQEQFTGKDIAILFNIIGISYNKTGGITGLVAYCKEMELAFNRKNIQYEKKILDKDNILFDFNEIKIIFSMNRDYGRYVAGIRDKLLVVNIGSFSLQFSWVQP